MKKNTQFSAKRTIAGMLAVLSIMTAVAPTAACADEIQENQEIVSVMTETFETETETEETPALSTSPLKLKFKYCMFPE